MFRRIAQYKTQIITAIPLFCVNSVAVYGQFAYLSEHLNWPTPGIIVFAAALESTALYLAYMAHKALISLDSSIRLRIAAVGFGALAGFMNFTHYEIHGRPTFVSFATGLMSLSSPILWGIYSRRVSRDTLMEKGLIEPGAVRLGANRWLWHFSKSFAVYRMAAWTGERNAHDAITEWEVTQEPADNAATDIPAIENTETKAIEASPDMPDSAERDSQRDSVTDVAATSKAGAVSVAIKTLGIDTPASDIVTWLGARGWTVTPDYVRQCKSREAKRDVTRHRDGLRAISGSGK